MNFEYGLFTAQFQKTISDKWVNQQLNYDRIRFRHGQSKWIFNMDKKYYQTFIWWNTTTLISHTTSKNVGGGATAN